MSPEHLLQEQIKYYRDRANEYDEWFLRKGRYDTGEALNQLWFKEVEELTQKLKQFSPKGEVLELACGTGWWTEQLAKYADHLTAIDASPEVIALNQKRVKNYKGKIDYQIADLFTWKPEKKYDVIFFSFWLSHVPKDLFIPFWKTVMSALKPNGRVFLIDSTSHSSDHVSPESQKDFIQIRQLKDGRKYNIIKIYYSPEGLEKKINELGYQTDLHKTQNYFLYGTVKNS